MHMYNRLCHDISIYNVSQWLEIAISVFQDTTEKEKDLVYKSGEKSVHNKGSVSISLKILHSEK